MNSSYIRLIYRLKPYRIKFLISFLLALLFAGANIYFLPLVQYIFREIGNKNVPMLHNYILEAIGVYIIFLATKYGQFYVMADISNRMIIDLRLDLYKKLQLLSSDFYQKWRIGDILSRCFTDMDRVKEGFLLNIQESIPQVLKFLGVLGYMFYINWKLALFSLIGIPIFMSLVSYLSEKIKRISNQIQQKNADITHIVQEAVSNIHIIKAYTAETFEFTQFKKENNRSFVSTMQAIRITTTLEPFIAFMQFFIFALIAWYGSYEVALGAFSGPKLGAFFVGLFLLIEPISSLSKLFTQTQQSMASADRIFEILDIEPSIRNSLTPVVPPHINGKILFKDVCFSYHTDLPYVLKNINLEVQAGEIIAIVGLSGAGKSTLVNLLPRFYDPSSGTILVDGIDLKNIDLLTLRTHIGLVTQEPLLFRGTILENIRYGRLSATNDEIVEAAKKANAWEFIEKKPNQLFSQIGDRGIKLSGGQKQRLSIARAILRDPKILILDEATSALDSKSEKLVQQALVSLMEGRTTFVIAHRLSTIMHAHKIIVLDNGEIKEIGTHKELLALEGIYYKLFKIQFEKAKS